MAFREVSEEVVCYSYFKNQKMYYKLVYKAKFYSQHKTTQSLYIFYMYLNVILT